MSHATFLPVRASATSPSPFSALPYRRRPIGRAGSSIMIGLVRAAIFCATLSFGLISALPPALAADKAFKRDDLADSSIKLEAQIKSEAGAVNKSGSALKANANAAFKRNDYRT